MITVDTLTLETEEESVTEEELLDEDDFAEPELPEEPSPFDHIFDQQKEIVEDETVVEEPEITEEAGFDAPAEESRFREKKKEWFTLLEW